jgi:predicted dehydrogenase
MRIAFIGGYGHHYLRGTVKHQASIAEPVTVAAAGDGFDDAHAKAFAEKSFGPSGFRWFESAEAMLDDFKPDFVSVGGAYGYNGALAALALQRDVPTVTDKPAAATWEQLARLRELYAENPARVLVTEFNFRSEAPFRAARDAIAAGELGDVTLANAQKCYKFGTRPRWYADRAPYAGTMLWIASHAIDAIRFATGKRYRRVLAIHGNAARPEYGQMEDHTAAIFELDGGAAGIAHADYCRPAKAATHGDDRLRVAGTRGVAEIIGGRCRLVTHDAEEQDITSRATPRPAHVEMLAALRSEERELYSTDATLELAEVLLHARDAADTGRPVEIRRSV